jgi:hypothetical protein
MSNLQVTRWSRYGKDRLYVKDADGRALGWVDLQTGEHHPESPSSTSALHEVLRACSESAPISTQAPALSEERYDLARNRPGDGIRAQAEAATKAAPVKTRLARLLGVHTDPAAWRIGAKGEQKVGRRLDKLAPGWKALHSIPVGRGDSDIDHLVVGPGGVFTVNTKHHPGKKVWVGGETVLVSGHPQPYVRNARFEAQRAARCLGNATTARIDVVGLIAIVGAEPFTVKAQPEDGRVHVLARRELVRWLQRRPVAFFPGEVDRIFDVARDARIWRVTA